MRNGRTGRGYKTVVRLLREFTDLTEYSYDTEVVMMLGQESLSESCCSKLGRHAGGDSRWEKTSLIERKGEGDRLIGGAGSPDTVGLTNFAGITVTISITVGPINGRR